MRTFQSRLAAKQEPIKRKLIDNNLSFAGNPTDCICIRETKNDEGDIEDRVIVKADVVSIIWPAIKDVPIRKINDTGNGSYTISSLVNTAGQDTNTSLFKLYFEHNADISVGDLIVRVFIDPDTEQPTVIAVKVSELLGTYGQLMILYESCNCTLDTEAIPDKLAKIIGEMAKRRLNIKY